MRTQTSQKAELFARTLRTVVLGVFAVFVPAVVWGIFIAVPVASAAVNSTINFQARLETSSGSIVPDGDYNVEFKLYNASSSSGSSQGSCTGDSACLWTETRTYNSGPSSSDVRVHVTNGYLTVNLGSVTSFPTTINWNQQLWLTMNIGGTAGSGTITWDGEMSPRLQLTAVPYSFQAGALGNGTNQAVLDSSGNLVFQQASTVKELSAASGTALTLQGGAATSGTNVGGNLILQGGAGASSGVSGSVIVKPAGNDSATAFQVQSAGGTGVLTVDTSKQTVAVRSGNDIRTLGSELYSGNFSSGWTTTGWNVSGTTTAAHNTGNTSSLVNTNVPIVAGTTYAVSFTVGGTCATINAGEWMNVYIGGTNIGTIRGADCDGSSISFVGAAGSTAGLTFTPTSNWPSTLSNISIKALSGTINPALVVQNNSGSASLEVRANSNTTSTYIGLTSGSNDVGGYENTALGFNTLQSNLDGSDNTALGAYALQHTSHGYNNTGVGTYTLYMNTNGNYNAAFGDKALYANTTGSDNTAVGESALTENTSGGNNTAIGNSSLSINKTGSYNTALGDSALDNNISGSYNIGIGVAAGGSITSGSNNTAIGLMAGGQDSGSHFLTLSNLQNVTAIGAYAQVQANNSIVLGSVDTATKVGIGITVPSNTFSVSPLDYQAGTATRTNSSATLVGTSTVWTSAMVGDIIVFADGTSNTVSAFTDATHITMGTTYTGTTDASPVYYRFHRPGFQVTSSGNAFLQNTSTTAFQVQNSSGSNILMVDTTNSKLTVGGNLVVNAASGFSGNIIDLQVNGTSELTVNQAGAVVNIAGGATVGAVGAAATVAEGFTSATVQNNVYTTLSYTTPTTGFYGFGCWWRQANTGADTIVINYVDGATSSARTSVIGAIGNGTITAMSGTNNNPNLINTCITSSVYALASSSITITFKDPGATPSDQFYAWLQRIY